MTTETPNPQPTMTASDLDRDLLAASIYAFTESLSLPKDQALRDAIVGLETAAHLAVGGDPNSPWLALLDEARSAPNEQALRDHDHRRPSCVLRHLHAARPGTAKLPI